MTKFKEIYSSAFIAQFGDYASQFGELSLLSATPYVDLDQIAKILGLKIDYAQFDDEFSGNFDEGTNTIKINRNHPQTRIRFTIAHEIGHDVLGHHGISLRSSDLGAYQSVLEKSNEMAANNFAATLLMPRALLIRLVKRDIHQLVLDDMGLTPQQVAKITKDVADELAVSEESMTYRFQNVRLFVEKND